MTDSVSRRVPPRQALVPGAKHRIQPYIEPDLYAKLVQYCIVKSVTESAVVNAVLRQFFGEESDHTRLFKRLDRHSAILERIEQHLAVLGESFGVYIQCWFASTPSLATGAATEEAHRIGKARAAQFFLHVANQFGRGGRLLNELLRPAGVTGLDAQTADGPLEAPSAMIVGAEESSRG